MIGSFVKKYPEKWFARLFSRIFWPPPSVAVLAWRGEDKILALNRDGEYRLPGGIMNAGEGPREAARREVREETGLDVEIHDILDLRTHHESGFTVFFEAEVGDGELKGSWEGSPEFVEKEEVREKVWSLQHSHIHEYLFPDES